MNQRRKSVFAESYEPGEEGTAVNKVFNHLALDLKQITALELVLCHFVLILGNEQLCEKGIIVQTLSDSPN